jgi:hypothetical protein
MFALTFTNLLNQEIRAFDGVLTFTDLLDNIVLRVNLAVNDPIAFGDSIAWNGELEFNQFFDTHQRLKSADVDNLKVVFDTRKILFEDGSTSEYQ